MKTDCCYSGGNLPDKNKNDCAKKAKRKRLKRKIIIFFFVLDIFLTYVYCCATNLILDYASTDFQYYISNCSYYALNECLSEKFDFASVCEVQKNNSGEVTLIKTDTLLLNYISQKLALSCYDTLSEYMQRGLNVPLGTFSGIRLLSGFGKKVNVKITNTLSVECNISRSFTQAGINQTRQVISAIIHADITVYSLLKSKYYVGDIEIPLYDNVIVGKVPEVYLGDGLLAKGKAGG